MTRHSSGTRAPAPYEQADIAPRPILATLLILLVVLVTTLAVLYPWRDGQTRRAPAAQAGAATPTEPGATLARLRARQNQRLTSYGWIDRGAGIAHIPVERAIELLLSEDSATAPAGKEARP